MNSIISYCQIIPGKVWLNGRDYFNSDRDSFVMDDFFNKLYQHIGINYRRFHKMDALSKLGFLASEMLLAGVDREQPKPDMGIILFNASSSLGADIDYQKTIQDKTDFFPSPAEFVYTLPNIVTGEIAIRNKIYGETMFYVVNFFNEDVVCSTIDDAMRFAGIQYALAGWVEVDAFTNEIECLLMLCASKQGVAAIEKSESCLSKKTDGMNIKKCVCLQSCRVKIFYDKVDYFYNKYNNYG